MQSASDGGVKGVICDGKSKSTIEPISVIVELGCIVEPVLPSSVPVVGSDMADLARTVGR